MANYYLFCFSVFKIALPLLLSVCFIFRPTGLSTLYLLFLLCIPFIPVPTRRSMAGSTGIYLKILLAVSLLTFLSQLTFQIVLMALTPYGSFLEGQEFLQKLLRLLGFVKLNKLPVITIIIWISPEIIALISSIVMMIVFKKIVETNDDVQTNEEGETVQKSPKKRKYGFLVTIGRYAVLASLCFAAILRPSVEGGIYFIVFLSAATWWACCRELHKAFAVVLCILNVVVVCHIFTLYAFQFEWTQEVLDNNSTYARYFGLTRFYQFNSDDPRKFDWVSMEWASYMNPLALLWLYYVLVVEARFLLKPQSQKKQGTFTRLEGSLNGPLGRQLSQRLSNRTLTRSGTTRRRWQSATRKVRVFKPVADNTGERTPLIHGVSPSRRYGSDKRKRTANVVLQGSTGSVTVTGDTNDDIPMQQLGADDDEEYQNTLFDNIIFAIETLLQVIIRASYIATNIIMMTWSITYLSWLTFVLLLWANFLWLVPNQRRSMLRSSPFLVIYAWFLLLSAYIYSMDLTEEELPSTIIGINLAQIGFQKVNVLPCNPLLVKCLYTVMFWITLRQYIKERREARQTSALADMVAPLQVTVGTATGVSQKEERGTQIMRIIGDYLKKFLTQFWIWIVAITLFAVAITGEKMTAFRIIYMALFLFFILSFQISFNAWRKMMFGFWLTVIIYSMIILVLTYTYQFDNVPKYWEEYLHISLQRQKDIGLEIFETKQLFVRLVTPTFFVIITVIQLQYFHKEFMELSETKAVLTVDDGRSDYASSYQGTMGPGSEQSQRTTEKTDSDVKIDLTDIANISTVHLQMKANQILKKVQRVINLIYLCFELHMPKIVLFVAMLVCVYDKCALYMVIVILIALSFIFGRPVSTFAIYISSILVSILLLARMIYQIQYIEHDKWKVTCEFPNETVGRYLFGEHDNRSYAVALAEEVPLVNYTYNSAEWLGFYKTDENNGLPHLVRWNIAYILIVTLWAVVLVRQYNFRVSRGKPTTRPYFMFPHIKRSDADKNLKNCLKYLANFGFYKFGIELSFMAAVTLIGFRMDLYSVVHSIWLCVMFAMKRSTLSRIWNIYLVFIAVFLPIQYLMTVGLPPSFCIEFPWMHNELLHKLQDWAYLFSYEYPPPAKKLLCDFVLLLVVSRQSIVFRIEWRYAGQEYPGGSNESIIHFSEQKGFVNPVPDFITYCRTYLDICKRVVFLSFLWVTLAIVFLAGTNRVNMFSIGYLICAFIFLWQGSDLYLRPIPVILRLWNGVLGYNISVILAKSILHIVGCVFLAELPVYMCWFVQIFGIGCIRKFDKTLDTLYAPDSKEECQVPRQYVGLVWDGLCFGFLILQRRIFQSYNFFHMIDETKATTILASRGAELIEELRQKRMVEQSEEERRVLEKIKVKMDKIKENQQRIKGPDFKEPTSHDRAKPPLARSPSLSSCTSANSQQTSPGGYHTPIDDDEPAPLTPHTGSVLQTQAPSPYSALMTVSLDGYLEPQRISFSSPPNSDLNPHPPSPDDSFPVFSPPPYTEAVSEQRPSARRQSSLGPPWMQGSFVTPRQSIFSYSSRSPLSHHTYGIFTKSRPKYRKWQPKTYKQAIRSGDYYMFDDLNDEPIELAPIDKRSDSDEEEDDEMAALRRKPSRKFTVGELLSSALKSDIASTLKASQSSQQELLHARRSSMPLARQRSSLSARTQFSAPLSAPPTIEEHSRKGVKIVDARDDEPRPGTSKDDDFSDLTEPGDISTGQKALNVILFIWAFIESVMVSATNFLNRYTRDYRYVVKVLKKEKKILKEKTHYSVGLRVGSGRIWQPVGSFHTLLRESQLTNGKRTEDDNDSDTKPTITDASSDTKALATSLPYVSEQDRRKASVLTVPEIRILAPSLERGLDSPTPSSEPNMPSEMMYDFTGGEMSQYDQPTAARLCLALWYMVLSNSDILCYFMIFLNQIKSATFLSLPLPFMVFFWGTLSIPRPTKTFWITIIAYTEAIVLIKSLFQFEIISWNRIQHLDPFYAPRIIGIEQNTYYAVWDLLLLLVVFFHRFLLKSLGLWKTTVVPAVKLVDGEYIIENGQLKPVSVSTPSSSKESEASGRRASDLQRLVEENEETADEVDVPSGKRKLSDASDKSAAVSLRGEEIHPLSQPTETARRAVVKYGEAIKHFFVQLADPSSRVARDVYSYMFLCDFFNFFVILIGYSSFGPQQGDGGVSSYLEDNRVPVLFLLMLILQFALIIIDRAIFLRKFILGKIVFQFLQILILHVWLFIVFPLMTERSFNSVVPPQIYYMVKCFYLLLSAYQIRCGYPTRILGNFLCKGYTYVNMVLFKGFMAVPFLFELRAVMDWMWTDTSMTIFDWIKMEDIFQNIYMLKCNRNVEDEYPQPRGERKPPMIKYLMGGGILAFIIAVIWFPLVFFSLGNAVGESNPPFDVTIDIRIGPYEPVYKISAQSNSIFRFSEGQLGVLNTVYNQDKKATTFLSNYVASDVVAIKLSSDSANIWSISPPDEQRMIDEISSTQPLTVKLQYKISHKTTSKEDPGVIPEEVTIIMPALIDGLPNPARKNLLDMINGTTSTPVELNHILPKFIKVTNRGTAKPLDALMQPEPDELSAKLRTLQLRMMNGKGTAEVPIRTRWWEIEEVCSDENYLNILKRLPYADCNGITIYAFNDKVFPATLSIITGGGIIGLYTTLVFVASRILRGVFSGICFKIMFEDMPNVDRILQLCLDVYLVREAREFSLEEDLFAKLVFLFRSPETLIKWSRPKEELEDDDNPEGDEDGQ